MDLCDNSQTVRGKNGEFLVPHICDANSTLWDVIPLVPIILVNK